MQGSVIDLLKSLLGIKPTSAFFCFDELVTFMLQLFNVGVSVDVCVCAPYVCFLQYYTDAYSTMCMFVTQVFGGRGEFKNHLSLLPFAAILTCYCFPTMCSSNQSLKLEATYLTCTPRNQ